MALLDHFPAGAEFSSDTAQGWFGRVRQALNKIDTDNDIIVENTLKGIVLRSPNLHYWRATISNAGVVTWTDLGLTRP